jgi:hypothetical protein
MMHIHLHLFLLTHVAAFLLGILTYRCLHRIVFKKLDSMKQRIEKIETTARCMRDDSSNDNNA